MKKLIALLAIIAITAFTPPEQPKVYTFKFTDQQLNALMYSLDKSTAEYVTVKQLQQLIGQQYQAQVAADTTKRK